MRFKKYQILLLLVIGLSFFSIFFFTDLFAQPIPNELEWDVRLVENNITESDRTFLIHIQNGTGSPQNYTLTARFVVQTTHEVQNLPWDNCSEAIETIEGSIESSDSEKQELSITFTPRCCRYGQRSSCEESKLCNYPQCSEYGYHAWFTLKQGAEDEAEKLSGSEKHVEVQCGSQDPLNWDLDSYADIVLHRIEGNPNAALNLDNPEEARSWGRPPQEYWTEECATALGNKTVEYTEPTTLERSQVPHTEDGIVTVQKIPQNFAAYGQEENPFLFINKRNQSLKTLMPVNPDIGQWKWENFPRLENKDNLNWSDLSFYPNHKLGITSDLEIDNANAEGAYAVTRANSLLGQGAYVKQTILLPINGDAQAIASLWKSFINNSLNNLLVPIIKIVPIDNHKKPIVPQNREEMISFANQIASFWHHLLGEDIEVMQNLFIELGDTPNHCNNPDFCWQMSGAKYGEFFATTIHTLLDKEIPKQKANILLLNAPLSSQNTNIASFIPDMIDSMNSYYQNHTEPNAAYTNPKIFFSKNLSSDQGYWATEIINSGEWENYKDELNIVINQAQIEAEKLKTIISKFGYDVDVPNRCQKIQEATAFFNTQKDIAAAIIYSDNLTNPSENTKWDINHHNFFFHIQQLICYLNTAERAEEILIPSANNQCVHNCCGGNCPNSFPEPKW